MALYAMAMPILPGKKQKWLDKMDEIKQEPVRTAFRASREDAGVHERSFLQETPHGDFVILTFEGDDPAAGFGKIMAIWEKEATDPISKLKLYALKIIKAKSQDDIKTAVKDTVGNFI